MELHTKAQMSLEGHLRQQDPELEFWRTHLTENLANLLRPVDHSFVTDLNIRIVMLVQEYLAKTRELQRGVTSTTTITTTAAQQSFQPSTMAPSTSSAMPSFPQTFPPQQHPCGYMGYAPPAPAPV